MSLHRPTKKASSRALGPRGHLKNQNNSTNTESAAGCQSAVTCDDILRVKGVLYKVGKKLGEGTFGIVYAAIDLSNHRLVAIKFERCEPGKPQFQTNHKTQLQTEYEAYGKLKGSDGIPNVYYFGRHGLHNILILDQLGPSLEDLFDGCGRKFTLKTVVMIGKQMISIAEALHGQGLIHRDIKPENFLIHGPGSKYPNKISLIDPAMAENYRCSKTERHIPPCEGMDLVGTARYMSINAHLRKQQSRRDDLESIFYVLFYLMRGGLPWQGLKAPTKEDRLDKILEIKQQRSADSLCGTQSTMFVKCLEYVRELGFEQDPDYDYLKCCLTKALEMNGEAEDDRYDWDTCSFPASPLISPSSSQTSDCPKSGRIHYNAKAQATLNEISQFA
ncbi:Casein kinase I 2 like protein [Verticillium longisporum]|nr:Casein kinase I 2 like protein [Verticillium longisporum]